MYKAWLKPGALLSPVLERSLELEMEAEEEDAREAEEEAKRAEEEDESPRKREDPGHEDLIDKLLNTRVSPSTTLHPPNPPHPPTSLPPSTLSTPEQRAQRVLDDVRAVLRPQTSPLDSLSPPTSEAAMPASMQERLFALLRQVTRHLDQLTQKGERDEVERAELTQRMLKAEERVEQLQGQVAALESAHHSTVQQVLAAQREVDLRVDRLLRQQQSPSQVTVMEVQPAVVQAMTRVTPSFPLPPPFVSAQLTQPTANHPKSPARGGRTPTRQARRSSRHERKEVEEEEEEEEEEGERRQRGREEGAAVADVRGVVEVRVEEEVGGDAEEDDMEPPRPRAVVPRASFPPSSAPPRQQPRHSASPPSAARKPGWPAHQQLPAAVGWTVQR